MNITETIRKWVTDLMIGALYTCTAKQDQQEIIDFLKTAQKIVGNDGFSFKTKLAELYRLTDARKTAAIFMRGIAESVKSYKDSDLPWAVKIAVPVTLGGAAIVGGQGVGIAALGGAVGAPAVLLIFIGAAGIGTIIEAFVKEPSYIKSVMTLIVIDEAYRRCRKYMQNIMTSSPAEPKSFKMPEDEQAFEEELLKMDPFDFERYVMNFFKESGLHAWVTKRSNDHGVDGFAKHPNGLIIVQCKHYTANPVGGSVVRELKGTVEENEAWRGYIVTTSYFTRGAKESADKSNKIILSDMNDLKKWHSGSFSF